MNENDFPWMPDRVSPEKAAVQERIEREAAEEREREKKRSRIKFWILVIGVISVISLMALWLTIEIIRKIANG